MAEILISENWRVVEDFPAYAVSNLGRVKRVLPGGTNAKVGRILKHCFHPFGYPILTLTNGDKKSKKLVRVHRLVCRAFHGAPPTPYHEVAHNDGNPANINADNLRWSTKQDNQADRITHNTHMRGERHYLNTLTVEMVEDIRNTPFSWGCINRLAEKHGVTWNAVRNVRSGKAWAWLPDNPT